MDQLGYLVISPDIPGMTTQNPFQSQNAPASDAIFRDGFIREGTAGRIKTAETLAEHFAYCAMLKRKCFLIEADETEDDFLEHSVSIGRQVYFVNPALTLPRAAFLPCLK